MRKIKFTKEQREEIKKRYLDNLENPIDIGESFNCTAKVIVRILKEEKVFKNKIERRKELIKNGKLNPTINFGKYAIDGNPHNKGLTKENCESLKKASKKLKGRKEPWLVKRNLENNPMKNIESRKKSSKTKKLKFQDENFKKGYLEKNKGIWKSGEEHPFWQGGISFEPYDKNFNEKFKRAIRKRDNQICMLCGIHREKLKRALQVHHLDYNKLNTLFENCISLCNPCHAKTNINRSHWTKFFQSLLSEKYGYKYSELGEIIIEVNNENK